MIYLLTQFYTHIFKEKAKYLEKMTREFFKSVVLSKNDTRIAHLYIQTKS